MWALGGMGCLVIGAVAVLLWDYGRVETELQMDESSSPGNRFIGEIRPAIDGSSDTIAYRMTRWDVALAWLSLGSRNRLIQLVCVSGLLTIESVVLKDSRPESISELVRTVMIVLLAFVIPLSVGVVAIALSMAFLCRRPEVLGPCTLSITERGLLECTELNETLLKWPAIRKVRGTRRYLFISATDFHAQVVPKRCVAKAQLKVFEAEIRARINRGG